MRLLIACLLLGACGGTGVEGDWLSDGDPLGPGASLRLEAGGYDAYVGQTIGRPPMTCRETGTFTVVGREVTLEVSGPGCMPSRALAWNGADELWLRNGAAFWFVYRR